MGERLGLAHSYILIADHVGASVSCSKQPDGSNVRMDGVHAMRRLLWLCAGRSLSFLNDEPSCIAIGLIGQQGGGRGPGRPLVLTGTLTDLTGGATGAPSLTDLTGAQEMPWF